jgi:hypothetical protein
MGASSFIVRGKGNPEGFASCSHGAGRTMCRDEAKRRFTLDDHRPATEGVECRKDSGVANETPAAYQDIDAVMAAQQDLVEVIHTLKQSGLPKRRDPPERGREGVVRVLARESEALERELAAGRAPRVPQRRSECARRSR